MSWTDERVEILRKLWLDGRSAGYISSIMDCGLTRNAVIGKIHRLKLGGRAKDERRLKKTATLSRPPQIVPVLGHFNRVRFPPPKPPAPPVAPVVPQDCLRVTFADLDACMCKWPLQGARYCGLPTPPRVPYCGHHRTLSYQPGTALRPLSRLAALT